MESNSTDPTKPFCPSCGNSWKHTDELHPSNFCLDPFHGTKPGCFCPGGGLRAADCKAHWPYGINKEPNMSNDSTQHVSTQPQSNADDIETSKQTAGEDVREAGYCHTCNKWTDDMTHDDSCPFAPAEGESTNLIRCSKHQNLPNNAVLGCLDCAAGEPTEPHLAYSADGTSRSCTCSIGRRHSELANTDAELENLLTELVVESQREALGGKSDTSVGLTKAAIQAHTAKAVAEARLEELKMLVALCPDNAVGNIALRLANDRITQLTLHNQGESK